MSKRVSNKKGGGGARSKKPLVKEAVKREILANIDHQAISNMISVKPPRLMTRVKHFFRRKGIA